MGERARWVPARRRIREPERGEDPLPLGLYESQTMNDRASTAVSKLPRKSLRPAANAGRPFFVPRALAEAFATSERINQFLLDALERKVWRANPPSGAGRKIAEITAHMHNVRHMWLLATAAGQTLPDKLDRAKCTKKQAQSALKKSAKCMVEVIRQAAESPDGRVKNFRPDVVGFLSYAIAHEAHHRGQICLLTRELGHPLSKDVQFGMWEWSKRWKDCGFE
jgi:uncharacterized damage-inducible protein DinB